MEQKRVMEDKPLQLRVFLVSQLHDPQPPQIPKPSPPPKTTMRAIHTHKHKHTHKHTSLKGES